ncbi:MAG: plasmid pRiA4b ORF-3 family protein [Candidatus Binatia bacterium]
MTKEAKIYQLKITLKYIRPPIWRRIQVRRDITLATLHRVLQITMGWYDSHLHQFRAGKTYYGAPDIDEFSELDLKDDSKTQLGRVLTQPKQKLIYEYDFGDGWEHEILLEKVLQADPGVRYPRCLGGARACPPEDCGGAGGYENFLAAIRDPRHEEHDEYLEWIGGGFDPGEFDLEEVDSALRHIE